MSQTMISIVATTGAQYAIGWFDSAPNIINGVSTNLSTLWDGSVG